jgi:DNA replication protein DnaC
MDGWMDGIDLNCQLQPLFCARAGAHRHHRYPVNFTYTNRRRHHQEHRPIPPPKAVPPRWKKNQIFLFTEQQPREKKGEREREKKKRKILSYSFPFVLGFFFSFFFKSYLFLSP